MSEHLSPFDVSAFARGELTAGEQRRVELHLARCHACEFLVHEASADNDRTEAGHTPTRAWRSPKASPAEAITKKTPVELGATNTLSPGERVDQFEVVELIGRGGLGEVYLARDTKLSRKVALKIVRAERLGSKAVVRRFLFEARATAHFNHPNIVTIYDVGEHKGSPYFALEFLEGQTLGERLRSAPVVELEALQICHQIAAALRQAHKNGVVHRDLKPDNVFLPEDGPLRVLDFGMGKLVDDEAGNGNQTLVKALASRVEPTQVGLVVGTPSYMAPEQWLGAAITPATDVYALGLILFSMLTRRRPFGGAKEVEELRRVALAPGPLPGLGLLADVTPDVAALVSACLEKRAERRPSSQEVFTRLAEILNDGFNVHGRSDPSLQIMAGAKGALFDRNAEVEETYSSFVGRPTAAGLEPAAHASTLGAPIDGLTEPTLTLQLDRRTGRAVTEISAPEEEPRADRRWLRAAAPASLLGLVAIALLAVLFGRMTADAETAVVVTSSSVAPAPTAEAPSPAPAPAPEAPTLEPPDVALDDDESSSGGVEEPAREEPPREQPDVEVDDDEASGGSVEEPAAKRVPATRGRARPQARVAKEEVRQEAVRTVICRAPAQVRWLTPAGAFVGRGTGRFGVPADTASLLALDVVTGARSRVSVSDDVADYGKLGQGKVWFQAKPFAQVKLGRRDLGVTPFKPVELVVGSYVAKMSFEGKVREERFEVSAGEVVHVRVDMR